MKNNSEHIFYKCSAIWYLLTVFWGFAPSFYLSRLYEDYEPLPLPLILHGIIFTIWVVLYAVQVFLIGSNRYTIHMGLGILGIVVMVLMVPTGLFPSIYKYHIGATTITGAGHNVFRLFSAYLLFGLAFIFRKRSFLHKRFILGCMVMLMSAATFRILMDFDLADNQILYKGIQVFPALCLFVVDLFNYKKVVWIDLISVALVFIIFFFASNFWLTGTGNRFMDFLLSIFVLPFL